MNAEETNRMRTNRIAKAERTTRRRIVKREKRARIKAFLDARG